MLDACVLFPASLRDTLLRLAETPRQYIPKWSAEILEEVTRNLAIRRGLDAQKISHLVGQMDRHFPEARVTNYEKLIARMTNHPKDRHVAAAAVKCGARLIVTSNLKDFAPHAIAVWGIKAQHPDDFLVSILGRDPDAVLSKLHDQAATIDRTLAGLLHVLGTGVPRFANDAAARLELQIG